MMIDLKNGRIRIIIITIGIILLSGVGAFSAAWKHEWIKSVSDRSFEKNIDQRVNNIIHSKDIQVMLSSNPYYYVKDAESSKDFEYIVSHGERSLKYMMSKLEKSEKNGIEEYIMAMACAKILNEMEKDKNWTSGNDWLSKYLKNEK